MNMDEFNSERNEIKFEVNRLPVERQYDSDGNSFGKDLGGAEHGSASGSTLVKATKKQKTKLFKSFQTIIVAGIITAFVGTAAIVPAKDSPATSISEVNAFSTYVQYVIDIAPSDAEELTLVIYNDYFKHEAALDVMGESVGTVDGLKPNKSYTIAVKCKFGFGKKTLAKKTFRTLSTQF